MQENILGQIFNTSLSHPYYHERYLIPVGLIVVLLGWALLVEILRRILK